MANLFLKIQSETVMIILLGNYIEHVIETVFGAPVVYYVLTLCMTENVANL